MNIKPIIAAAMLLIPMAASSQVAVLNNEAGGQIVLTLKTSDTCSYGTVAYSTSPNNQTIWGCWTSDEVMVHVLWLNSGAIHSYPISAIKVVPSAR